MALFSDVDVGIVLLLLDADQALCALLLMPSNLFSSDAVTGAIDAALATYDCDSCESCIR